MLKSDIQNLTIPQLATVTARALFAMLFPLIGGAALTGFAAGIAVTVYRVTVQLLP
jgi:hypothetical protein